MSSIPNPKLKKQGGSVIEINSNPFTIGRGLCNNYVIPSKEISRIHCIFENTDNKWWLRDTSTNGTLVNSILINKNSTALEGSAIIEFPLQGEKYMFLNEEEDDDSHIMVPGFILNDDEFFHHCPPSLESSNDNNLIPSDAPERIPKKYSNRNKRLKSVQSQSLPDELGQASASRVTLTGKTDNTAKESSIPTTSRAQVESFGNNKKDQKISEGVKIISIADLSTSTDNDIAVQTGPSSRSTTQEVIVMDLPKENIPKLADVHQQVEINEEEDELQCSICSEMFVKAVTLGCSHSFCKYCIELWRKTKSVCPICRTKITSVTSTLVLDNFIEKIIQKSTSEMKQHRTELLAERKKLETSKQKSKSVKRRKNRRNRAEPPSAVINQTNNSADTAARTGHTRTRRVNDNYNPMPPFFSTHTSSASSGTSDSVIEVSDTSNSSSGTEEYDEDWRERYDDDDWHVDGDPEAYYGGYGSCFICGRSGHWANGCIFR